MHVFHDGKIKFGEAMGLPHTHTHTHTHTDMTSLVSIDTSPGPGMIQTYVTWYFSNDACKLSHLQTHTYTEKHTHTH